MFESVGREQRFGVRSVALEVAREYIFLGQVVAAYTDLETEGIRKK